MSTQPSLRSGLALPALLAPALFALAPTTSAQVSHGGTPVGLVRAFENPAPVVVVDPPDVAAYLAEDEARNHRPLRYGALVDLELTLGDGAFEELEDGGRAWRLRLVSPGAHSLSVEFDELVLPEGAQMFVYNDEVAEVLGAYTHENHHLDGTFVFEPFPGNDLTIEIDLPAGVDEDPYIDTRALIYDYRDVFGLMNGTITVGGDGDTEGGGDGCLIDVNCSQGDGWDFQKRATVRTFSGGGLCSGALMNNTSQDRTNYILTANHCGQSSNTVFSFKYERSGCNAGTAPTNMTVSGCTVLTSNGTYDNRLLRHNGTIPESYEPYYAGWTRTTNNASFAFAMGHPSGGPKKISIDGNGTNRESQYWRVTWTEGTLEGGSSGGPIFDQLGYVRGPACCVNQFNCSQTAWFGRFDRFWTNNGVDQWLDPIGTGTLTLDGLDPLCSATQNFCLTSPNSVGPGMVMESYGTNLLSQNDFVLSAQGGPPNAPGIFFFGDAQTAIPFGNGWRCVTGNVKRLPALQIDLFGQAYLPVDFDTTPANTITTGQDWYFQFWYRNIAGGGAGFNLSDGLQAEFCP